MRKLGSRTYKLCLSEEGFDQLLDCHCRVGRMTRSLVPYGATLFVGLTIADDLAPSTLAAALIGPLCGRLIGRDVRFVGFTGDLADLTMRLRERIAMQVPSSKPPKVNRLYAVGLSSLAVAGEEEVAAACRRLQEIKAL